MTIKHLGFDCFDLANESLSLLVTQSVGPRIISLRFKGGDNLFAELPDSLAELPDGRLYHFYGGHRLWHAPENMPRTYVPDDKPVEVVSSRNALSVTQPIEVPTGIQKSIHISLVEDKPQVILHHELTNRSLFAVECAPWTITQFRLGGVAILPQSQEPSGLLPNRSLALWPYTDVGSSHVTWGNRYILLRAEVQSPFKVGFPNPRGWLAYWLEGTLFVKRAVFNAQASYCDFNSSSECYCNSNFIELETLAPLGRLSPGESVSHTETWELYSGIDYPENEDIAQGIVENLGLE